MLVDFIPTFGAFLGEALFASGGHWERREPVMTSRGRYRDDLRDPWQRAYDFSYYDVPIDDWLD
jgi:hypothetical protein